MKLDSLRYRFFYSFIANILRAALVFGSGLLVARGLGPEEYGLMVFLLGTFTATRQLLDMGSSTAFFTFLSQRQRAKSFVGWYLFWLGIQFIFQMLAVGIFIPAAWLEVIWKSDQRFLIILAFVASFVQSVLWSAVLQLCESQRLTRRAQGGAMAVALIHFLLIWIGWWGHWLDVRCVFLLVIVEWTIAVFVIAKKLRFPAKSDLDNRPKSIFLEFWRYCKPLIPYAWLSFAYEFADRWLLQTYGGSVQQAYYAVAFQFASIAAIATSSILNIFWKEIAEAHHHVNRSRVAALYQKVSRGLFFIAAAGAGFLAPWSEEILRLTLGAPYSAGGITLMVMLFYPLHQSMGQIGGAMAYATGRVQLYVLNGMAFMALSVFLAYFALADSAAILPGLGLGSIGLAGKMVLVQIISVNSLAFFLCRSLGIQYDWKFQPLVALGCGVAGFISYAVPQSLFDFSPQFWVALPVSGTVFALLMIALVGLGPNLVGLDRKDLFFLFCSAKRMIHRS